MRLRIFTSLLFLIFSINALYGFGQNKVQYDRFNWTYFQTKHFDIYYSQEGDSIATYAAKHVEEMHDDIAEKIGHSLKNRVPIILHNSHAQFEQTNVIRMALHEGIGGFTELFKNRIVLPFEGNYPDFYHVLKHEMVHSMVNDMLYGGYSSSGIRHGSFRYPLWVNEGLAEFASLDWNLGSEFFMLDATTSGYVTHPAMITGGFLAYKGGQMFFHFLEEVYGVGTSKKWIQKVRKYRSLEKAFQEVTQTSLEEAGEIWLRELRYIYWPELGIREHGKHVARKLTNHGRDLSFINLQPTISPNNKEIAFFSDRKSREGIFIIDLETEKVSRSVIQGGTKGKHESFHAFKSGISWGPNSKRLAIVSKSGGKDVIHLIDAKSGSVLEEISPDVHSILSPSWSHDGKKIAFAGSKTGYMDIYVWDRVKKNLKRLTNDKSSDDKPTFSPSGKWIAFESDRSDISGEKGGEFKDVYKIKSDGSGLGLVSHSPYDDKMPTYGPSDSLLIFVSNRSGIDNIYLSEVTDSGYIESPITNVLSGCFTPNWSRDGKQLVFSLFESGGWDVFVMKEPLKKKMDEKLPKTHFIKVMEDTTLSFFRNIDRENLSSYLDSAEMAKLKEKGEKDKKEIEKDSENQSKVKSEKDSSKTDTLETVKLDTSVGDSNIIIDSSQTIASTDSVGNDSIQISVPVEIAVTDTAEKLIPKVKNENDREKKVEPENKPEPIEEVAMANPFSNDRIKDEKYGKMMESRWLDSSEYLEPDGTFKKKVYTPKFSLDLAEGGLAYNNFEGSFGQGVIVLSDLMGDQEIEIQLNIGGDFDNSHFALGYNFLPYRMDYSIRGSYSSYKQDLYTIYSSDAALVSSTHIRSWGGAGQITYPLSIYTRFQLNTNSYFYQEEEERLVEADTVGGPLQTEREVSRAGELATSFGWSHDNIQWGIVGPVNGERINASVSTSFPVYNKEIFFFTADMDFRKYLRFLKRYTLAFRLSAGLSENIPGFRNPHNYWLGGDDFYIVHTSQEVVNDNNLPNNLEERFFSSFAVPLRGYRFFEFAGNRKVLSNLEFRFPFIREFSIVWPIPMAIRYVTGVVFADYGAAWTNGSDFLGSQGMGIGFGMRMNLGIFVLRWTRAWPIDGVGNHEKSRSDYWSLGAEF